MSVNLSRYWSEFGKCRVITEGDILYAEMCRAIEKAENEILLESYIFVLDPVGKELVAALNTKAGQGLQIKIHLDAVGSHYFKTKNQFADQLHENIELEWFHRWSIHSPLLFNVRNHRKLLVIDRATVFIGGFNIHMECSLKYYGKKRIRDTHIVLKSATAAIVGRYFDDLWHKKQQIMHRSQDAVEFFPNLSRRCRYLLHCQLSQLIENAQSSILITTPYFVPDEYLIKSLIQASENGIKVSLLVPIKGDHPIVNAIAWRYYTRLTEACVEVYAYIPRMLHAKTIVVDKRVVVIGSANMDYRSLFINHELTGIFRSDAIGKQLSEQFERDTQHAIRITPITKHPVRYWWFYRPVAELLKHWI